MAGIDLEELIDVRGQLGRHAMIGAAAHYSDENIARLLTLVETTESGRVSSAEFNELDTEFHVSIA